MNFVLWTVSANNEYIMSNQTGACLLWTNNSFGWKMSDVQPLYQALLVGTWLASRPQHPQDHMRQTAQIS